LSFEEEGGRSEQKEKHGANSCCFCVVMVSINERFNF